jgi:hypothetical protein
MLESAHLPFHGEPVAAAFPMRKDTVGSSEPAIRIRHHFPETWLWQMLESGYAVWWTNTIISSFVFAGSTVAINEINVVVASTNLLISQFLMLKFAMALP